MYKQRYNWGKYESGTKRVNIPLPNFDYVHKSWISRRRDNKMVGYLIGRDRIIEKLKTWLIKEKTDGGSYLITGYRGMGKTSFVDNVIYELVGEAGFWDNFIGTLLFVCIGCCVVFLARGVSWGKNLSLNWECLWCVCVLLFISMLFAMCKRHLIKEWIKRNSFNLKASWCYIP